MNVKPRKITSTDLQRAWGETTDAVRAGETVLVTSRRRPMLYIVPWKEYEALIAAQQRLKRLLPSGGEL